MVSMVSLEQVESLAVQLQPRDQLALVAHLTARLSVSLPVEAGRESEEGRRQELRRQLAAQLLAECEGIEDDAQGSDTAETIRNLREERIGDICPSDA